MDVAKISIDRAQAAELYRQYKDHRHYSTPVDDEIRNTYRLVSQGKVVIQALESIKRAGIGADGYPKLAIGRADLTGIYFEGQKNGAGRFYSKRKRRSWRHQERASDDNIILPPGSFPGCKHDSDGWAQMPLIPVHLRPRHALDNYHVLWEAEWSRVVPRDPYLLRRIGNADLWLVLAAWDLTEVERAALATRVMP